jgi:hypothetical protein
MNLNMQNQYHSQKKKGFKNVMRYSGLTFSMLAAIGFAVFAGLKADKWLSFSFPLFVVIFPFLAIVLVLWRVIKSTAE